MKKILAITTLGMAAIGAFAQGQINFNNNVSGSVVSHVFAPQTDNPGLAQTGNRSQDTTPPGTTVYNGGLLGGASTGNGFNNGLHYTAQIWSAGGTSQPLSSLVPITQYTTTMRSSGGAGFIQSLSFPGGTDPGLTNTSSGTATVQLRVWDNQAGTGSPDWATAVANNATRGSSLLFNVSGLFNGTGTPGTPVDLVGLTSFNIAVVPEPSTIALGVMGAAAFMMRRRNKK